eukprot:18521-Heterococcus_DN1.PRE.3
MRLLLITLLLSSVSCHVASASITSARPAAWQKKLSLRPEGHASLSLRGSKDTAACLRASLSLRGGGPLTRGTKDDSAAIVLTYLPNLIGYFRVALLATSIALAPRADKWVTSIWAYIVSFALDGVDGYAARWLNQTSKRTKAAQSEVVFISITTVQRSNNQARLHGSVLADRCATAALLVVLASLDPALLSPAAALLILDISSHWAHMYSAKTHHKTVNPRTNAILRVYYGCKPLFLYSICSAEAAYILTYVRFWQGGKSASKAVQWALLAAAPGWAFKQLAN